MGHPVRFERAPRALWRRAGAEVIATLPENEETRRLSGSAASVWMLLDAPTTVGTLVTDLGAAYGVEPGAIAAQVAGCVDELLRLGLVEEVQDVDG